MASPAPLLLLRVKRKATETPVEAIEVTGAGGAKRRKTATAVFRLKSEDDAAAASRKRKNVGGGGGGDAGKDERKRFKVVQTDGDAKVVDLIIEKAGKADEIACNGVEMVREKVEESDKFVYDEYFADGVVFEDLFGVGGGGEDDCGGDFVVREYLDEYSDLRLDFRGGPGSDCDGDSDSNDENNWRNEYPDEDDEDDDGEEYNKFAYDEEFDGGDFGLGRKMRLSDEGSSSSGDEDGDDPLVYSVSEANTTTADLHGESYARFKRKVLKDLHPELDEEEDEDDNKEEDSD